MNAPDPRTPVLVLTGFLGSGKTTLLNRLLRSPLLADSVVLVNEFGAIGIDHQLIVGMTETTVLLESGCVCCVLREDLKSAILTLHERRARGELAFRRLVLETTGLADPVPVLHTLGSDPQLYFHYRVAGVVTTVDAVNAEQQLTEFAEARQQVRVADALVVTKTDLVAAAPLVRLRDTLAHANPLALHTTNTTVAVETLLALDPYGEGGARRLGDFVTATSSAHVHPTHANDIESFCLFEPEPFDWSAFGIWLTLLLHAHGAAVLRVKGLLNVRGLDVPVAINGVQHVMHPPFHLAAWPDADRRSRIVFIVRGLARARIEASFAQFRALA